MTFGREHILVVEDDHDSATLIEAFCEEIGYCASVAHDAKTARLALGDELPDALILDVGLPDASGLDLLADLRAAGHTSELPVLLISGNINPVVQRRGEQLQAHALLRKPFRLGELSLHLGEALKLRARPEADRIVHHQQDASEVGLDGLEFPVDDPDFLAREVAAEVHRAQRYGHPLSLILACAVDEVSKAHPQLRQASRRRVLTLLRNEARETDRVFRAGPDSALLLLPETELQGALTFARRLVALCDASAALAQSITCFAVGSLEATAADGPPLLQRVREAAAAYQGPANGLVVAPPSSSP